MRIEQFSPICLVNVSFNFLMKVRTNRLSQIAHVVVQPSQRTFMPGRNIFEGVVVLHESLHEIHTKKPLEADHKWQLFSQIDVFEPYCCWPNPQIDSYLEGQSSLPNQSLHVVCL